jgi:hypothetical protein
MLIGAALLTLALASFAWAHGMGGNDGQSPMTNSGSQNWNRMMGPGMMGQGMMMGHMMGNLMGGMYQQNNISSSDIKKLEDHVDEMIQIKDMAALKTELKEHRNMLTGMQENTAQPQTWCQDYMSDMYQNGPHGSTGMNPPQSNSPETPPESK